MKKMAILMTHTASPMREEISDTRRRESASPTAHSPSETNCIRLRTFNEFHTAQKLSQNLIDAVFGNGSLSGRRPAYGSIRIGHGSSSTEWLRRLGSGHEASGVVRFSSDGGGSDCRDCSVLRGVHLGDVARASDGCGHRITGCGASWCSAWCCLVRAAEYPKEPTVAASRVPK